MRKSYYSEELIKAMTSSAFWVRSEASSANDNNSCSEAHLELFRQEVDIVLVGLVLMKILKKLSCASTWTAKEHDISKDGWPGASG